MKSNTRLFITFFLLTGNYVFAQDGKQHIFNSSAVVNAKPILFNDISFNSGELLSANFQYANKNNTQKIVLKPFGFSNGQKKFWNDTKLNLTQKDGITTAGLALSFDNTAAYNQKRIAKILASSPVPAFNCNPGETLDDCTKRKAIFSKNTLNPAIVNILQKRIKNSFTVTGGYNISLFEIIGGDKVLNADNLVANEYKVKAHSFSVDFSYSFSERTGISFGGLYQNKRKSSVQNQKMIKYYGTNFTLASWLTALDKDFAKSDDYNKNLFASSIYWGVSFEYMKADGDSKYFEDGIQYQYIITPFLDFRISPKSQFRIGVPIKKYNLVDKSQLGLGPFLQYALQLSDKS